MTNIVPTVAEYVVSRLADLGVDRVFGVPGDYACSFDDAIVASERVEWIVCANELNAAYAADGYARINGVSILSTTYGVGELSALNGVMGRYGIKPIIFVLNNGAYGVEIVLSEKGLSHDDLAKWNYAQLPAAMGCES